METGNTSEPAVPQPPAPQPATAQDSSTRTRVAHVLAALLMVGALVWIVVLHRQLAAQKAEANSVLQAHLNTIVLQTEQVQALDQLAVRVDRFNREFGASLGRLHVDDNLEANLKALDKAHLPADAQKSLEDFEKSVAEIQQMTAKMKEFERYLGLPTTVKRGDSHSQIARNYLVQEAGLTAPQADEVVKRTALAWDLEPGNQVFNLYHEGILLSTVTQGTAKRSPLMAQWAQRRATSARVRELEDKVRELEARLAAAAPAPEAQEAKDNAEASAPAP